LFLETLPIKRILNLFLYSFSFIDKFFWSDNNDQKNLSIKENEYKNKFNILFIGRVSKNKFPLYIIDVAKECQKFFKNEYIFNIVGKIDSIYFKKVKSKIRKYKLEKKFFFTGGVSEISLGNYYKQSDIFVNFSHSESFGLTLVEALYSGLPVISTRVGIIFYLEKIGYVKVFENYNYQKMDEDIYLICNNIVNYKCKVPEIKKFIENNLSLNIFVKKLYKEIINF
jgi:glycosyltransferase involved in cell wall biosynthesis